MFYSSSTSGFYVAEIHGEHIPADAVEISIEDYSDLMAGQANGMSIRANSTGHPELVPALPAPDYPSLIAGRRYQAETAGIEVNGTYLSTDRDSQALVTGAALQAVIDPSYTCRWKTAEGFVTLDAPSIIAMTSVMRAHVQACFDREAELLAHLEAGTFEESMLDQGWPA
ncbi:phage tail protein [Pseudomonas citronellolis]|uniref:Phage tail protein n=1 Tax=Pseudomonas citronellolis TaxID=53408 RepID=A0A1A9K6E6_9PSED|nr:DUF4376 domain-containing protein [Pseudomonas citronellolis]ANI13094.1 phage tail protein [Pseudomonas citronellolis]